MFISEKSFLTVSQKHWLALLASFHCNQRGFGLCFSPLLSMRCFHGGWRCPQGAPTVTGEPFCGLLGMTVRQKNPFVL